MTVTDTSLTKESRDRYLTYALSVVSGRALPDVRDGLKPVQRRILFAMLQNLNLKPAAGYRKSAAVVGEVLARFHPHGDVACYEAMVRMAQDFSLRYPLIDGQGNFGSLDGDGAAAYRYTEAKLTQLALEVVGEIDEETVLLRNNFDATQLEPAVLPSRIPNLLINGASGIAVGMATSIPPHNLREVVKALIELSEDEEILPSRLSSIVKGPDFPTGCMILNTKKEISEIYRSGKGSIRMRGEWSLEEGSRGKRFIIISSIPYAVNKSQLVEKIADLIVGKKVPQLTDIRDESTDDVRVVIELATGADAEVAMAYLYKHTPLESNFPVNMTALVPIEAGGCRPELLSLKQCLQYFLDFREEVTHKKLAFEKRQLEKRIHILEGLVKIYDRLDEAIKIVRKSDGRQDAAMKLKVRFKLSDEQSFAVVDMRIYQLSRTNIDEIRSELKDKKGRVSEISALLSSKKKIAVMVRSELNEIAEKYGDKRRSKLEQENIEIEFRAEDYVVQEDVFAVVTHDGWIKRIRQNNELTGTRLREGDRILRAHPLNTVDSVAFITNHGSLFVLKVSDFPSSSGYGEPIQKMLKFRDDERVVESFGIKSGEAAQGQMLEPYPYYLSEGQTIVLVTQRGVGFALKLDELGSLKRTGKRIMKIREGDNLACVANFAKRTAFFTRSGSGLVIDSSEIPVRDSAAVGVSLMGVREKDQLVSAVGFDSNLELIAALSTGKEKEILTKEMMHGRRSLKGNKVVSRGEITAIRKVIQ